MSNYQIRRGETWSVTWTLRQGSKLVDLSIPGTHILLRLTVNPNDADSAALALLDNEGLGGIVVTMPQSQAAGTLGQCVSTTPASATYGLPNVQTQLYYEIWVNQNGAISCLDSGSVPMRPRGLQQQP